MLGTRDVQVLLLWCFRFVTHLSVRQRLSHASEETEAQKGGGFPASHTSQQQGWG